MRPVLLRTEENRVAIAFHQVARERKWPLGVAMERFAANCPKSDTELVIFTQQLREDRLGELTSRGWVTLTVDGRKHDLGIIRFDYRPRAAEWTDKCRERTFLGFANTVADKIDPLLSPKAR